MKKSVFNFVCILAIIISLLAVTPASPAYAASLTVNTLVDENDHSCLDGDCSLRDAVEVANNADTISFSVTGVINLSLGNINISKNINITGPGANLLTINANSASRIFIMTTNITTSISGLTLTNGLVYDSCGGAIAFSNSGTLTLNDMVVSNNKALKSSSDSVEGGAICNYGTLNISNSTLNNNTAWSFGGAIFSEFGTSLTLSNVILNGNKAQGFQGTTGGAIDIRSSQVTPSTVFLDQVTITNNTASFSGGGISIQSYATVTIQNSLIQGNSVTGYAVMSTGDGGGIIASEGTTIQIINTTIKNNTAQYKGGGIASYGANFTIRNSTISNNQTQNETNSYGGGIYAVPDNTNGSISLGNTTVSGNSSPFVGGMFVQFSSISLRNVTIAKNTANEVGGIYIDTPSSFSMANTIIADNNSIQNENEDCSSFETLNSLGHNLVEAASNCTFTVASGDIFGVDPKLNPLANNGGSTQTHSLQIGSPALDAGDNSTCLSADQRNISRPQDGDNNSTSICDIGAFEKVYTAPTATFDDVPVNYWSWQYIEGIYSAGVTSGCTSVPLNYCPGSPVTRAQMAVFLLKSLHGGSYAPPPVGVGSGFSDVSNDYWAAGWIKQLAAEGITSGCGNGNFCPDAIVTRDQMAVFLLKAKNGNSYVPPAVGVNTGFNDVAIDYWAAAFIKQLVVDGITSGCGNGNYCPEDSVTRAQMAVFLVKTFNKTFNLP